MVPEAHVPPADRIGLRLLSALILAPLVVALTMIGGAPYVLLVIGAGIVMAWEWSGLLSDLGGRGAFLLLAGVAVAAGLFAARGYPNFGLATVIAAAVVLAAFLRAVRQPRAAWMALGVAVIGMPVVAFIWLRQAEEAGTAPILVLFAVVWSTDIAAYAVGRAMGGPRLAPLVSPSKTWSGAVGGVAAGVLAGYTVGFLLGGAGGFSLVLLSALLSIVAQMGDLLESLVKRHFGVKDAGSLIPGHGGLLDRVDSLVLAAMVMAILNLISPHGVGAWL
jgi:phosphatidate cytidylyltransferase